MRTTMVGFSFYRVPIVPLLLLGIRSMLGRQRLNNRLRWRNEFCEYKESGRGRCAGRGWG